MGTAHLAHSEQRPGTAERQLGMDRDRPSSKFLPGVFCYRCRREGHVQRKCPRVETKVARPSAFLCQGV